MLRRILIPLDGSHLSEKALEYARSIVAPDGELFLLTIVDMSAIPVSDEAPRVMRAVGGMFNPWESPEHERRATETIEANMISSAEVYLRRIANQMRTVTLKVDIDVETDVSPAEAIVQTASALDVDAIVLATHGRSGLSRLLLGSVTHKVLDALPCPVFVIPARDIADD